MRRIADGVIHVHVKDVCRPLVGKGERNAGQLPRKAELLVSISLFHETVVKINRLKSVPIGMTHGKNC